MAYFPEMVRNRDIKISKNHMFYRNLNAVNSILVDIIITFIYKISFRGIK